MCTLAAITITAIVKKEKVFVAIINKFSIEANFPDNNNRIAELYAMSNDEIKRVCVYVIFKDVFFLIKKDVETRILDNNSLYINYLHISGFDIKEKKFHFLIYDIRYCLNMKPRGKKYSSTIISYIYLLICRQLLNYLSLILFIIN